MEISGQLHAAAALSPIPTVKENVSVSQPIYMAMFPVPLIVYYIYKRFHPYLLLCIKYGEKETG
jgi:hypothetical protein